MNALNVLICGVNEPAMQRIAQILSADGIRVETHHPVDLLVSNTCGWDLLLIELDGLTSFVSSLLPMVCRRFPKLPVIGISTSSGDTPLDHRFKLDACLNKAPRLEDLIILAPHLTAKYLCDTDTLRAISPSSPPIRKPTT